jgi:cytoskeletal protein CcmA (bactofilin family)
MLGKNTEKLKSFLGVQSEFQGELIVRGILRVDGTVTGKVQADQVIVSETAVIKGDILATKILVCGKVDGNLNASSLVEIGSKGKVKGEISTSKLHVMEGGDFNGKIEMKAGEPIVLDFQSKNQDVHHSLRTKEA